ncbi:MAG: helix-turn-helix domain-containing protein [Candidatus Gastranaerophilales bacterium]|nr:helix-turn-helix domain-containing protein [Candidatus Gastranaerophilales bacterium]MCM1073531.1 helix-turn-helix domain-containing protein [Bacteroides sp.]
MKLDELITIISQKTGNYINQSMLAESLGITRQTVSNRIKNESQVTVSELKKIEEHYGVTLFTDSDDANEDVIKIDYYTDVFASCGMGSIVFSEEKIKLPVSTLLIGGFSKQKTYSMINASGDSMAPTIDNGDRLIVEHWNGTQIQDNKIYVFCFNNEFFVKRLSKNLDEIIIKSDNPEYRVRTINGATVNELTLIGKIVGVIKSLA